MNMHLPMLQVALDNLSMAAAYDTTRLIAAEVDIIEVGTILCVAEGVRAVRDLKSAVSGSHRVGGRKNRRCGSDFGANVLRGACRLDHGDLLRRYQYGQGEPCRWRMSSVVTCR